MLRTLVHLRDAVREDAPALTALWGEVLRRAEPEDQAADLLAVIERVEGLADERLLVAELDGAVAGAVHLRATTLSPLNLEPVVQAISPHVFPEYRRHGVGRALMDAAVAFAEERGIGHVASAAAAGSRDANRFMARLALGPHATLRVAPVQALKAKLTAQRPVVGHAAGGRHLTQVLAARRSMRRARATGEA